MKEFKIIPEFEKQRKMGRKRKVTSGKIKTSVKDGNWNTCTITFKERGKHAERFLNVVRGFMWVLENEGYKVENINKKITGKDYKTDGGKYAKIDEYIKPPRLYDTETNKN